MNPRALAFAVAVAASSLGCAPSLDTRPLTPAERAQLIQEHESAQTLRKTGVDPTERTGCVMSDGVSRMLARGSGDGSGHGQGNQPADAFDSRGCQSVLPAGSKP